MLQKNRLKKGDDVFLPWKMFRLNQEAHISQYFNEQSFPHGDQGILYMSRYQGEGDAYRIYMTFNLKGKIVWRKGSHPRPAFLRLFVHRNEITSGAIKCSLFQVAEPWHPSAVCWKYQPACKSIPRLDFIIPAGWQGYMFLDLSLQVQGWLESDVPNYGFMIKGDESRNSLIAFHGASYPFSGTVPALLLGTR